MQGTEIKRFKSIRKRKKIPCVLVILVFLFKITLKAKVAHKIKQYTLTRTGLTFGSHVRCRMKPRGSSI